MSSWKKYGGTSNFDKTSELRLNSLTTNYFTILRQITNDVDISGNLIVGNRLNVYGDVSFNQNITIEGNAIIHNDLDISGNLYVHKNEYIDGNLTVLNHLYFEEDPAKVYMYGNDVGISINKDNPEADFDICGNHTYTFNVKSSKKETHNILCRNVDDKGIMLSVDACNATIGYYYDNSLNVGYVSDYPDAYIQYNSDGGLHIQSLKHVQIVTDLLITDVSSNLVNDSIVTVYNDLSNTNFLYDIYDVSSVYSGTAFCGVSRDPSSNISFNLISKNTEIGGAIYGGAYPKDLSRGMLSIGTIDYSSNVYKPAQTIVSGTSNVLYKNTTGINRAIPKTDHYSLDVNGCIHIDNNDITIAAHIPFEIGTMRFSRLYPNSGIVIGGPYEYDPIPPAPGSKVYSQNAFYTTDGGSYWNNSNIAYREDNIVGSVFMRASWVYDDKFMIAYGDNGKGYCLDVSNNIWFNKTMTTIASEFTTNIIDIFACDFSGSRDDKNALSKVFFLMYNANPVSPEYQLRYFNAAFGENSLAYIDNPNYVSYYNNNAFIEDNTSPLTYYRYDENLVTGKCIDGAGYFTGTDCSSGYIYIAGDNIKKYLFSGIGNVNEVYGRSHNSYMTYNAISVADMSNVFVVGNGIISHTVNGGLTWTDISRNTSSLDIENVVLKSVWAYDASNAVAVGYNGAVIYTKDGYIWKNVPPELLDLSGSGFQLVDASLNNVFFINKNDFVVSTNNTTFAMDADISNVGFGTVIYNHVPELLNSTNNTVLDLCGNMTIAGNIIVDRPSGNICSTGNNFYIASNTPNIYIGDGTSQKIYLGNDDINSVIYFKSRINFGTNLNLNGGFTVSGGNILINANNYLVSYGLDVSFSKLDVVDINGGNASSRLHDGTDISYALHVGGYRPAVRFDASLSVNELYVDNSAIFLGPMKSVCTRTTDIANNPALSVDGYSKFGSSIAIDGSNGLITLSSGVNAVNNVPNNLYGGLYLTNGTGAYIDGNVYIGRNVRITGTTTNTFIVDSGTAVLQNVNTLGILTTTGNIVANGTVNIYGNTRFRNNIDISGNVSQIGYIYHQGNMDLSGFLKVNGDISCNDLYYVNSYQISDYRVKTNVLPLADTSFNIDKIVPKYYYNKVAKKPQIGFIAHELQEEYPFLVSGTKDGHNIQSVDYPGLIGVLVKEIQDLKTRVSVLENGIA